MTITIKAHPHPGQGMVQQHPARFRVLAAGRRWGKTRLGVNECLDIASMGGRAWWVAPNYKMGEVGWRPLRRMGNKIGAEVRRADRQIVLPGGGDVTVRSADKPDTLRGEGLDFVVLDECAFIAEDAWIEALRPALSDRLGRAMFISTPKGRNWFWRMWQRGLDDQNEWMSWRLPTSDNPYIEASEIEAARDTLPELTFEQEYLAEFLENAGTVFRNISANMIAPGASPEQHEGHNIVAGVDWGRQQDFTTISLGCVDCKCEIAKDRFNKIDYIFQRGRLIALCDQWKPSAINIEVNSIGWPNFEMLQREGMPVYAFETTGSSKPPLIENLALSMEKTEFAFLDDPIWTAELEAYERQVSPTTGRSAYSAPQGMHDDTVMARALMLWQANNIPWLI
ncbi:hypothetical protein LCGC14_0386840 [marine sediment metagenome]|uniref:Uncharacterized protein n=1 Tax=marine sediment metagenome TaxID=412755 RepID=A0A0F9VMW4_9ZZZZ